MFELTVHSQQTAVDYRARCGTRNKPTNQWTEDY